MARKTGPHLRIVASCHGCRHVKFTPSTANHHSFTECGHPNASPSRVIQNTHLADSTPQWCPLLKDALRAFTAGNPQHKVNQ